MEEAIKKVESVLCKKLKLTAINPEKELRELGLDSLDVVELLLELEDEFGIEFTSDELKNLKKVNDLYSAIRAKIKK
ncbi:MAG: phosphopantetheine-binding protein [Bacilli bacterium]|nr:phosphopantetheine-binding protein [Bacilli bacterium]